ncbi:MAG: hypothetical protein RR757_04735 [Raoultibacter sp.]
MSTQNNIAQSPWAAKTSSFIIAKTAAGSRITGTLALDGMSFRFSLSPQNGHYAYRGTISIIGPDGLVLQHAGKRKREISEKLRAKNRVEEGDAEQPNCKAQLRPKALNISESIYLKTQNPVEIKAAILRKAGGMNGTYNLAIAEALSMDAVRDTMLPATMVRRFCGSFLAEHRRGVSEKTLRQHRKTLAEIGGLLGAQTLKSISTADIRRMCASLGNAAAARAKLRLAAEFWAYCRDIKGVDSGANPFQVYLDGNGKIRKDTATLHRKALSRKTLTTDEERALNALAQAKAADGRYLGLALIKDGGLTVPQAVELTWQSVQFIDEGEDHFALLSLRNDDLAGATHNFSKPCFPILSEVLRRRYAMLRAKYDNATVTALPVVTPARLDNKALSAAELTAFCRSCLMMCGVTRSVLQRDDTTDNSAGVQMLRATYRDKLVHQCALPSDGAAVKFLLGQSLRDDTTSDSYASYSQADGQRRLAHALERDLRFSPAPNPDSTAEYTQQRTTLPDGTVEYLFTPTDPATRLVAEVTVDVMPGETIEISAHKGMEGSVKTAPWAGAERQAQLTLF